MVVDDNDPDELNLQLDPEHVRIFAKFRHAEAMRSRVGRFYPQPDEVARVSERLARHHYAHEAAPDIEHHAVAARCAGYLVFAQELYGMSYEEVNDHSEHTIARILAQLSPDIRKPPGPRLNEQISNLGRAEPVAQLVKAAAVRSHAFWILNGLTAHDRGIHADSLQEWGLEALRVLEALPVLRTPQFAHFKANALKLVNMVANLRLAARTRARIDAAEARVEAEAN